MRKFIQLSAVTALLCLGASAARADLLGPGSPAPKIEVKTWVKGTPVKELKKDKLYVVEFWATWCGPCRESIPHLTELAKANKDVTFVGVSIWEDDTKVADFVKEMGPKMDYNVAYGGNKDGMAQTWMAAAKQNGIPSAFLIKGDTIVWVGHPMELAGPLKALKANTLNVNEEKKKFVDGVAENEKQMAAGRALGDIAKMYDAGQKDEAKTKLEALAKEHPEMGGEITMIRMKWQSIDEPAACASMIDQLIASKTPTSMQTLAQFAMMAMDNDKAAPMVRKAIDGALAIGDGKDVVTLYYGVTVYEKLKDFKAGKDAAEKGLTALPTSPYKDNAQIKKIFETKRDEFAKKLAGQ